MSEETDANYIRLPTAVFFALIGSVTFGGAGIYGVVGPSGDTDKLAAVVQDVSEIRDHAREALTLATQNGQRVNDNRQLIFDTTRNRYSADDAAKDWRAQGERDAQHERRLAQLERELDRLAKERGSDR